ncbi:MAG TPA: YkvA family protein [Spirochaetota bacterium]|nr:YkvA family protein [Spirochaetota bacterium]HPI22403.1 YkvA family protein [Spirochaetota bacterium]HPU88564.1 YkvA family protein [Spirochaetota bacterium]
MPQIPHETRAVDKPVTRDGDGKHVTDEYTTARNRFIRALVVLILAIVYTISPIDLIPEALVGPLGLADDLFLLLIGFLYAWYSYSKLKRQRALVPRPKPQ